MYISNTNPRGIHAEFEITLQCHALNEQINRLEKKMLLLVL